MFNKRRIILTTLGLAAAIAFVLTQTASSNRQYKLGGGWIGSGAAGIWSAMQTPLDPAGRTAVLRVNLGSYSPTFAGLLAALGADGFGSDNVGEMEMISRDTAKFGTLGYGRMQVPGNPAQINTIFVMTGTVKFVGHDEIEVHYFMNVYPVNVPGFPNTDLDGDGFPDAGAQPIVIPGVLPVENVEHAKRVTLR